MYFFQYWISLSRGTSPKLTVFIRFTDQNRLISDINVCYQPMEIGCARSTVCNECVNSFFLDMEPFKSDLCTLIGETFARENFANFGLFRENLSRESFQNEILI